MTHPWAVDSTVYEFDIVKATYTKCVVLKVTKVYLTIKRLDGTTNQFYINKNYPTYGDQNKRVYIDYESLYNAWITEECKRITSFLMKSENHIKKEFISKVSTMSLFDSVVKPLTEN